MTQVLFSEDHEYIKIENGVGTVGITDFAQKALGDVVYVELPKIGSTVTKGGQAGVVESVKSASEIYSPVSGEITEVNQALADDPALVNSDPHGAAWFYKIKISDAGELSALKDEAGYKAFTDSL
ncbi:MAG TPA: glycine cleavage system protein GcvH [Alphaproteobacteria bacterium]|nr:glycine cleavage system protein GcvH [Rhodospirillaceae bacterium]HRJ66979.1 glycine cleavage system protein GcvH [Alphaproteobacteria bacterium]